MDSNLSIRSEDQTRDFYDFERYVNPYRMITYWYQIKEAVNLKPESILEIGFGPGVVAGTLIKNGYKMHTADVNSELSPDIHAAVTELSNKISPDSYDLIICARVLHHVDFSLFEEAIKQMHAVTRKYVILTIPVEDFRLYFTLRFTSRKGKIISIPFPRFIKKLALKVHHSGDKRYRDLWKINCDKNHSHKIVAEKIAGYFKIIKAYAIREDRSHFFYVLEKKA